MTTSHELANDATYRVSVTRAQQNVVLTIQTVSSTNQITVVDTSEMGLPPGTPEPVFPFLCVGGGAMEEALYVGVIERVMAGHIAVLETENSTHTTPSDLISFLRDPAFPSLGFQKLGLRSDDGFSFQFRMGTGRQTGILLELGNESFKVTVTIFPSPLGDILVVAGVEVIICDNVFVGDGNWHEFELTKTENSGLKVVFDRNSSTACYINTSGENFGILTSDSSQLVLGPTSGSEIDPSGTPTPFVGCFQKIRFVTGSRVFRANLEVPLGLHERFSGDGCRGCDPEYEERSCMRSRGACLSNGFRNITCKCNEPFIGPTCEG